MKNLLLKCGEFHRKHHKRLRKYAFFVLGVFLIITPVFYSVALMGNEMNKMKLSTIPTGKIISDVFVIKDIYVNVFLVKSDSGYIMIDTGTKKENLNKGLNELDISLNKIRAVFLTHSDSDHVGGIELVADTEIYMSDLEDKVVKGETPRRISPLKIPLKNRVNALYNTLEDAEVIEIDGRKIELILTPGHTPGSACFFIDDKYLFTGDTLSIIDDEIQGFVKIFTMDVEKNLKSIDKLQSYFDKSEYIFSQHHGYIKRD